MRRRGRCGLQSTLGLGDGFDFLWINPAIGKRRMDGLHELAMRHTGFHHRLQNRHVAFVRAFGSLDHQVAIQVRQRLHDSHVTRYAHKPAGFSQGQVVRVVVGVHLVAQDGRLDADARAKGLTSARVVVDGGVCGISDVHGNQAPNVLSCCWELHNVVFP